MDSSAVIYALRWLIHDTFRQALTSRVFWIMLGFSAICIVFCLGVSVEGGAVREGQELFTPKGELIGQAKDAPGRLTFLFGFFPITFTRTAEQEVTFLLSLFASVIAGMLGILGALVFSAGFLPESLQPSAAAVLLAKPVPRWLFLAGKYFGVVCFVALHVTIFFAGTWLALGLRTDVWPPQYLLGIPLMIFHFAVIFAFSALLATLFRSTTACVVGSVLFWLVCWAVNYGRHFAVVYNSDLSQGGPPLPEFTIFLAEAGYWLLPKPADMTILLEQTLKFADSMTTLTEREPMATMLRRGLFHPLASVLTSCLFPIFALWASASQLAKTDY